jgi:hypothetical protein
MRGRMRGGRGYPPNVAGHGDMHALQSVWASSNLVVEISSPKARSVRYGGNACGARRARPTR